MNEKKTRSIHFVFNTKSGAGKGAGIRAVAEKFCAGHQLAFRSYPITDPKEITDIAKRAVEDARATNGTVVASGGDGTIAAVAHAARETKVKIAVIPSGTFNWFARAHEIPVDPVKALEIAVQGQPTDVRIATVNGKTFILNATVGVYADSIRARRAHAKSFGRKRIVAAFATIKELLTSKSLLKIRLTSSEKIRDVKASTLFIGNNSLQLRELNFQIADCFEHGKLAIVLVEKLEGLNKASFLVRTILKRVEQAQFIETFCTSELRAEFARSAIEASLDGELVELQTPLKIRSIPAGLVLMKPIVEQQK